MVEKKPIVFKEPFLTKFKKEGLKEKDNDCGNGANEPGDNDDKSMED